MLSKRLLAAPKRVQFGEQLVPHMRVVSVANCEQDALAEPASSSEATRDLMGSLTFLW